MCEVYNFFKPINKFNRLLIILKKFPLKGVIAGISSVKETSIVLLPIFKNRQIILWQFGLVYFIILL